jgi:hypothetical protein
MEDFENALAQSPQWGLQRLATNWSVLYPTKSRESNRTFSLGTLKSCFRRATSAANFRLRFLFPFGLTMLFRVSTQRKQQLELSAYAHVIGMGPND